MRLTMIGGYQGLPAGLPGSGGGENIQERLAVGLARRGHRVVAYNRSSYRSVSPGAMYRGVVIYSLPALPQRSLATLSHSLLAALHVVRCDTGDVVHIHGMGASLWLPLLHTAKKRTVVYLGGSVDWLRPGWGRVAQAILKLSARCAGRWADALYVDNRPAQAYLQARLGRSIAYIPTGTETWSAPGVDRLGKYGLAPRRYLLHVSALSPTKGVHTLIRAFERVQGDCRLAIAGATDGNRYVLHHCQTDDPRVVFTGYVSGVDRQQLYSHAALYVQPSLAEGASPSLLAAMGCGVCPVVSDIPANLDVVGQAGAAFRAGDADDLREKLQMLLDSPGEAQRLGQQAAMRVRALFDWADAVGQIESLCEQVMAG